MPINYTGSKYDGLIGIGEGIVAGFQGYYDAQDRKYKKMEMDAKLKAMEDNRAQQEFLNQRMTQQDEEAKKNRALTAALKAKQMGYLLPEEELTPENVGKLQYDPEYLKLQNAKLNADPYGLKVMAALEARRKLDQPMLTPAQKAVDENFGKDYAQYTASGGYAGTQGNIEGLKGVIQEVKGGSDSLSGPIVGKVPEWLKSIGAPKSIDIKDRIRGFVFQSLRDTLGPQFTEKEGEKMVQNMWNDNVEEPENVKRLEAGLKKLETMAAAKQASADYYEQHGTLQGYKGPRVDAGLLTSSLLDKNPRTGLIPQIQDPDGLLNKKANAATISKKQDNEAVAWAKKNPKDPRAKKILELNGM